jgi:hypothetical protein
MMLYIEIYLILGLASFIVALITEYKAVVSKPSLEIAHFVFFCLTIWPYLWFDECQLTLADERKAKTEKLNGK